MKTEHYPEPVEKLPHVPSKLLRIAIRDLQRASRDPDVEINMSNWCAMPNEKSEKCSVCFAGAVMRYGLKKPGDHYWGNIYPYYYDLHNESALQALNQFRNGNVADGCAWLGVTTSLANRETSGGWGDLSEFLDEMRQLARDFAEEGN